MNGFDLSISSLINGFAHRSLRFDELVVFVSANRLLKGGVVVAIMWWIWFEKEETRRKREALLATIVASFPALAVSRILSWLFFRPRPLNDAHLLFRIPYGVEAAEWEGLSSFPSDHAVLFFALASGIFLASRRAGWFTFVYVTLIICLPRIFIGEHYATDILAGAAIGVSIGGLANLPSIRKLLTSWPLRWQDEKPAQFYSFSFVLTYQMSELFAPIIRMLKFAAFLIQGKPFS